MGNMCTDVQEPMEASGILDQYVPLTPRGKALLKMKNKPYQVNSDNIPLYKSTEYDEEESSDESEIGNLMEELELEKCEASDTSKSSISLQNRSHLRLRRERTYSICIKQ